MGPGVGLGVGLWDMVGVSVLRGVKLPLWMNLPVNTNTDTRVTKATKSPERTQRKYSLCGSLCSDIGNVPYGSGVGYTN